jgi:polysaccharide biosynthesis transport protein
MVSLLHKLLRAKYAILGTFLVSLTCVLILLAIKPDKYDVHISFLVGNERADPVVSTDSQNSMQHSEITEEDMNSEAELLGSSEILKSVVEACNLESEYLKPSGNNRPEAIEKATQKLSKSLAIVPVRKSSLINVAYTSRDRNQSVAVLNQLAKEYLAKRASLHSAGSAAPFFREKSKSIAEDLQAKQELRASILQNTGYTSLPEQKELSLQQMEDTKKALDDVNATLAETSSRLAQVTSQQSTSSPRVTTQDHILANQNSVERLNTMLVELRNKRSELAVKFRPEDPLLKEADKEIADTEAALKSSKEINSEDKTTDVNPIWLALDTEAHQLRQSKAGLLSRKAELTAQLDRHRGEMGTMEHTSIKVEDLDQQIKNLEGSLDLYRSKAISAEVAEDLDQAKISNVVVASYPIVPVLPAPSKFNYLTGLLFCVLVSLGVGLLSTMMSEKVYGASQIEEELGIPVLTSFD